MGVENEIIVIGIGIIFNYLVIYRKLRLLGNIGFIGMSIALMSYNTGTVYSTVGLIMLILSITNTIVDLTDYYIKKK